MEPARSIEPRESRPDPPTRDELGQLPAVAPTPTWDDPTADGHLCGARRSPRQRAKDPDAWPYCTRRSGMGTDHTGVGCCKVHGGSTPSHRQKAQLQLMELAQPAIVRLGRMLTDDDVPHGVRQRAIDSVLDRTGFPKRTEVDVAQAREMLAARLVDMIDMRADEDDRDG